jgi:hypothetical protein
MTNEQDWVWRILDDVTALCRENGWPTPEKGYKLDGGWDLALADLKRYIGYAQQSLEQVVAERDTLAEQNARLRAAAMYAMEECVDLIGTEAGARLEHAIVRSSREPLSPACLEWRQRYADGKDWRDLQGWTEEYLDQRAQAEIRLRAETIRNSRENRGKE